MPWLIQVLAGPLAESKVNPLVHLFDGDRDDLAGLRRLAVAAICAGTRHGASLVIGPEEQARNEGRIEAAMGAALGAALELVDGHAPSIAAVASALLRKGRLGAAEVARIVASTPGKARG
jgi:hypothetical protein